MEQVSGPNCQYKGCVIIVVQMFVLLLCVACFMESRMNGDEHLQTDLHVFWLRSLTAVKRFHPGGKYIRPLKPQWLMACARTHPVAGSSSATLVE